MSEMPLDVVRARIKLTGTGPVFAAKCPAHDDRRASLSVSANAHGDALIVCFAGCAIEEIVSAIGLSMRDLFVPEDVKPDAPPTIYTYRDERGVPLYEVVKTWDKRFSQQLPGQPGTKLGDVRRVLYRLPELVRATPSEVVLVVEGERDVENTMAKLGLVATSTPGGASARWRDEWTELFADRQVVIVPDNDEPGRAHAKKIFDAISPVAAWCVVLDLPSLPEKGDISDWIRAGGTREDLLRLVEAARLQKHPHVVFAHELRGAVWNLYHNGIPRGFSTGLRTLDQHYTVRLGEWTVITGAPGAGKSAFADSLCLNLAQATDLRVGIFSAENMPMARHVSSFAERMVGKPFEAPRTSFGRARMEEHELEAALRFVEEHFSFIEPQERGQTIDEILDAAKWLVDKQQCSVILVDPWTELNHDRPKGMTETEFVGESLWKIRRFARANAVHPILVAHPAKMQRGKDGRYPVPTLWDVSGSASWNNMADNGIVIYRAEDDATEVHIQKIRFKEVGHAGMVRLSYDKVTGRFSDMPEEERTLFGVLDDDD